MDKKVFFVTGPKGCGKTYYINQLCKKLEDKCVILLSDHNMMEHKFDEFYYERREDKSKPCLCISDSVEIALDHLLQDNVDLVNKYHGDDIKAFFIFNGPMPEQLKELSDSEYFGGTIELHYMTEDEIRSAADTVFPGNSFSSQLSEILLKRCSGMPGPIHHTLEHLRDTKMLADSCDVLGVVNGYLDLVDEFGGIYDKAVEIEKQGYFQKAEPLVARMMEIANLTQDTRLIYRAYFQNGLMHYVGSNMVDAIKYMRLGVSMASNIGEAEDFHIFLSIYEVICKASFIDNSLMGYLDNDDNTDKTMRAFSIGELELSVVNEKGGCCLLDDEREIKKLHIWNTTELTSVFYAFLIVHKHIEGEIDEALQFAGNSLKVENMSCPDRILSYYNAGDVELTAGHYDKAVTYLRESMDCNLNSINYAPQLAMSYMKLGFSYLRLHDDAMADRYLRLAEEYYSENDPFRLSKLYYDLAEYYEDIDSEKSKEYYTKFFHTEVPFLEMKHVWTEYHIPVNVFAICEMPLDKVEFYKQANEKAKSIGDSYGRMVTDVILANVYNAREQGYYSFNLYQDALEIAKELDDNDMVTKLLFMFIQNNTDINGYYFGLDQVAELEKRIENYRGTDKYADYLLRFVGFEKNGQIFGDGPEVFDKAVKYFKETHDDRRLALAMMYISKHRLYNTEDIDNLPKYYDAAKFCESHPEIGLTNTAYMDLADILVRCKKYLEAMDLYRKIMSCHDDLYYEALSGLSAALCKVGNFADAVIQQSQLAKHYEDIYDFAKASKEYVGIAKTYERLGDTKSAEEFYIKAVKTCQITGSNKDHANMEYLLGCFYQKHGRPYDAYEKISIAAEIMQHSHDTNEICCKWYEEAADICLDNRCYCTADFYYRESMAASLEDLFHINTVLEYNLSYSMEMRGQYEKAIRGYLCGYQSGKECEDWDKNHMGDGNGHLRPFFTSDDEDEEDAMDTLYEDELENMKIIRKTTVKLGDMYAKILNYDEAVKYYQISVSHFEDNKGDAEKAEILMKMARCAKSLSKQKDAEDYALSATKSYHHAHNTVGKILAYEFVGLMHAENHEKTDAELYLNKIENISVKTDNPELKAQALRSRAKILAASCNAVTAERIFNDAIIESSGLKDWHLMCEINLEYAEFLSSMEGRSEDCIKYYQNAIRIAKSDHYGELLLESCKSFSKYLSTEGDKAYAIFDEIPSTFPDDLELQIRALIALSDICLNKTKDYAKADEVLHKAHRKEFDYCSYLLLSEIRYRLCIVYAQTERIDKCKDLMRKLYNSHDYLLKASPELHTLYDEIAAEKPLHSQLNEELFETERILKSGKSHAEYTEE